MDEEIKDLTEYTTPLDADVVPVVDVANDITKKTTWANFKATLKTYFDTLYTYTIPVKATGAEINTGTDDAKFATAKAITDSNLAFVADIPVKAIGSEVDTGTDDAKFVTAKAINDSHNVPSVAPGTTGNVMTSNGTDWTSSAPASGAWSLVSYTTASAAASVEKTSIDLDTDKIYKIIIRSGNTGSNSAFRMTVNGTTSGYIYSAVGIESTTTAITSGSTSAAYWDLTGTTTATTFTGEYLMQMAEYNTTPNEIVTLIGQGMTANSTSVKMATIGGALAATNVTSIKIEKSTGSADWRMWILKANTA